MIFLGHCPDNVGLVAKICKFFAERGINITNLEEHTEARRFFIRIEAQGLEEEERMLPSAFEQISDEINMVFCFFDSRKKTKIALFCSGTLHCPLEILSRQLSGTLHTEIAYIISNKPSIERIAKMFSIRFFYTATQNGSFAHEVRQLEILKNAPVDLIALARYMKVLSNDFLIKVSVPVINIHHSFLPSFVGGRPYEMAYKRGVKIIGATAHFVTQALDEGPIISQDVLPVGHSFSIEEMKRSGANIEKSVFAEAVQKFSEHKIIEWQGRTIVFR
jgi:formyltetrahydrofolate deformylase